MNIVDTYNKYYLPQNLQMHMLRVATCSNLIIDNWKGPKKERIDEVFDLEIAIKRAIDYYRNRS